MVEDTQKRYADDVTVQELVRLRVENEKQRDEIERLREALKDKDELIQYLEGHIDGLKKFVVQQKDSE